MKKYLSLSVVITVVAVVLAVIAAVEVYDGPQPEQPADNQPNSLHVSESGSQIQTDVPGGQLQQGAAPANSAASSDQSPQQAQPNYCTEGELPVIDGCIAK